MILKTPRDLHIHHLCVIHLYEHNYTLLLAVKQGYLVHNSDKHHCLHPHQYGAVPGKNSVFLCVLGGLQYEISRASKRLLVHNDYNATVCYDQIIMNMGGLISQGFGQH